jgi:hypothetical protein
MLSTFGGSNLVLYIVEVRSVVDRRLIRRQEYPISEIPAEAVRLAETEVSGDQFGDRFRVQLRDLLPRLRCRPRGADGAKGDAITGAPKERGQSLCHLFEVRPGRGRGPDVG